MAVDEAIGDPRAVEEFVVGVLQNLFGVQVVKDRKEPGYTIVTGNLPPPQFPRYFRTVVNEGVARSLDVRVTDNARRFANLPAKLVARQVAKP